MFHYAWLFLSIVLVAGEFLEDSQFPIIDRDLPEAAKYALLWAMKGAKRIHDSKIFWVLMEMNIQMWINHKLQYLSPMAYNSLQILQYLRQTCITYISGRTRARLNSGQSYPL